MTKKNILTEYTLLNIIEQGKKKYGSNIALERYDSDYGRLSYEQLYNYSRSMGAFLIDNNINKGDKVAILGESDSYWGLAYFAIIQAGAVAVPLLPDFSEYEVKNILEHSGAKAIFLSNKKQYEKVQSLKHLELFRIQDAFHIPKDISKSLNNNQDFIRSAGHDLRHYKISSETEKELERRKVNEDDLASIIYTSGTTGSSKGVMLTHKNIACNVDISSKGYFKIKAGYRLLGILPLAHCIEFTFAFCLSLATGCKTTYLGKQPTASVLLPALKKIRPHIMLSVPLLIEKIYKTAVVGTLNKSKTLKKYYDNRLTHKFVSRLIGRKLNEALGGCIKCFGIGGAPLDKEVEQFLLDSNFPYILGYGLTETSPLVAAGKIGHVKQGVIGTTVKNIDVRVVEGEIQVKGPSVMQGYYNNEKLTKEVFTEDGYFRTGDLGFLDKKGRLGIKGRLKTMILGANGENIYPEPIEDLINNIDYVEESLVLPEGKGLAALVRIDIETIAKKMKISIDEAKEVAKQHLVHIKDDINKKVSACSKISEVKLLEKPLVRTPTLKIKRYLYQR